MLRQPLYVNLTLLKLPDLETLRECLLTATKQQILHLLIINLKHTYLHLILRLLVLIRINSFENLITGLRNDTLVLAVANHRVRFAATGLPVGEEAAVVALPGVVEDLLSQGLVNVILVSVYRILVSWHRDAVLVDLESIVRVETVVKSKRSGLPRHRVDDRGHRAVHLNYTLSVHGRVLRVGFDVLEGSLSFVEGSDAYSHFHTHCYKN